MLKLSVIICTYNRAYIIFECLDALTKQTVDSGKIEIIIIDNNSTDDTKNIASTFKSKFENFKYVLEKNIGLSHARNRGYKEASADWVFYLDDDGKIYPDCIEQVLWTIDGCKFDCFGGAYYPWFKYGKPKWYRDGWGTNTWNKPEKVSSLEVGYPSGGIMCIKKKLLIELNGYNLDIGMRGDAVGYGEETLLINRMRKAGYVIGYNPEIKMDHLVAEYKLSPFWFLKSAYAHGRDSWKIFDTQIPKNYKSFFMFLWRNKYTVKLFIKALPRLFTKNYYWCNFIIDVCRGIVTDFGRYKSAKKSKVLL